MPGFEHDPADGKIGFIEVEIAFFSINSLRDVFILFKGLDEVSVKATKEAGYPVYAYLPLEALEDIESAD